MNRKLYFDDVEVGDDIGPVERTVSRDQVVRFLGVHQGRDTGPNRFTSEDAAKKEGLPGAIVPGAMNISMISTLLTGWADTARLKKLDVVFRGMVPHDKTLKLAGIVTDKNVVDGEGRLECDVFLENDEGTRLIIGNAIVLLPER